MKKIFDEINDLRQVNNDIDDEKYKNVITTINNLVNHKPKKIDEIIEKTKDAKGEMVLIIEGNKNISEENNLNNLSIEEHYKFYDSQGFDKKEIIKKIAKDRNVSKNEIYQKFI